MLSDKGYNQKQLKDKVRDFLVRSPAFRKDEDLVLVSEIKEIGIQKVIEELTNLLLKSEHLPSRLSAANLIMRLDRVAGINVLAPLLKDDDDDMRWFVAGIFYDFPDARVQSALSQVALADPNPDVRYVAVSALGALGDVQSIEALRHIQLSDLGATTEGRSIGKLAGEILDEINRR